MTETFQVAKQALTQAAMLSHPHMEDPTSLAVDASDLAVGGVLQQLVNDQWEPLAFFSKKPKPAETKYSTFDGNSWGCI